MILNQDAAMPLYLQLKHEIKHEIESQKYSVNEKIPTEQQFSEQYKISRITVRKALAELVEEGYLIKIQGKGTFVKKRKIERKIDFFMSFSESCEANGMVPTTYVTKRKILQPTSELYETLQLEPKDQVLYIQRIRCADGQPLMCENNYYSFSKFSFLMTENLDGSLYELLDKKYGIHVTYSKDSYLESARANSKMAKLMHIGKNDPMFFMYTKVFDANDKIVHIGKQYILGDRYRFYLTDYKN
jgi:GntR family transcriptional regulator